jgi:hypothetical protein
MTSSRKRSRAIVSLAFLFVCASLGGCRNDHPFVPYNIGPDEQTHRETPDAAPAPPPVLSSAAAGVDPFAALASIEAPPGLSQWELDGVTIAAPDGQVFERALVGDFDGDGSKDVFALARAAQGADPGEALFYRGADAGGALAIADTFAPPPQLARDAACTPIGRLVGLSPRSVLVELGAACPQGMNAPARYVALIDGGPHASVRLAATLSDPAGAAALAVDGAIGDRDGDGRPDVALRLTIEGGSAPLEPGPQVSVVLAWLDRPAGLSRDNGTTEASFGLLAKDALTRAARAADAPSVPGFVAQVRALWRAACSEGGSPRLIAVAGTGAVTCNVSHALEEAGLADVRAYATQGDALRAALALDRAQQPPASHTTERASEALKWLSPLAPASTARLIRFAAAVPIGPRGKAPSWGALAFEPSGKLLIRTRAGVVRFDADLGDEAAAGVPDWGAVVASPDGASRWVEAYDPCDGLPLRATFELAGGSDDRDIALPVLPALSGRCTGSRGAPARVIPIAWGSPGLEAIIEGAPIFFANDLTGAAPLTSFVDEPFTPGAPRSPDGKAYVIPTAAGLLVRTSAGDRLFRSSDIEGAYVDQRDCAVSSDTTHVACVNAGRVWAGTWDAPGGAKSR